MAGGTAYAVDKITSHDIANNSIRSADLKNRKAVRGKDVKSGTITGRQINESTLSASSIAQVAGNETGDCVLAVAPKSCVATAIVIRKSSNLLVIASGNQESLAGAGEASCRIAVDGVDEALAVNPGEASTDNTDATATNGFARTVITRSSISPGRHIAALRCKRLLGQVRIDNPTIAAIAIAAH